MGEASRAISGTCSEVRLRAVLCGTRLPRHRHGDADGDDAAPEVDVLALDAQKSRVVEPRDLAGLTGLRAQRGIATAFETPRDHRRRDLPARNRAGTEVATLPCVDCGPASVRQIRTVGYTRPATTSGANGQQAARVCPTGAHFEINKRDASAVRGGHRAASSQPDGAPMSFQIRALAAAPLAPLFSMSDDELRARGAVRQLVDRIPGFPCRVSLADAEPGETVILVHHEHQPADTPYRAGHAIYVREGATEARPAVDEVPEVLRRRLLSVRAFDTAGMMVDADVVDGRALEPVVDRMFARDDVAYLHLHNAKPGCYAARVDRA
ncbi:hypothetical protein tb265_04930 [Gemmatimonadetes bacterium T265]|nr:hypothetical protein tb265_04930 [Gemmatimonadetes bacterium T265]